MNGIKIKQTSITLNNYLDRLESRTRKMINCYFKEFSINEINGPFPFGYTEPDLQFKEKLGKVINQLLDLDTLTTPDCSFRELLQVRLQLQSFQDDLPEGTPSSSDYLASKDIG